jgi:hypothetical protein
MLVSLFPAGALAAGFGVLFYYHLDERLDEEIKQSLRARRAEEASS